METLLKKLKNDNVKKIIKRNILDQKFSENKISEYISKSINITSEVIIKKKPDVIVILGDRYELLGSDCSHDTANTNSTHSWWRTDHRCI